jgi:hypothetical protein
VSSPHAIWVGRDHELERLEAVLGQTLDGRGGSALVVGEAGIGKTRLLEELAERARARGLVTAWGRGWELGQAPSYWPWLEILRVLFARPLAPRAPMQRLEPLLPEVEQRFAEGEGAPGKLAPSRGDGFAFFDAVQSYLRAHARLEPLALFIDDLHAVDPSSLVLAEFVARGLSAGRFALFGSQRRLDTANPELEQRLMRVARASDPIALAALTRADVADWMRQATGHTDAETVRRVHDASDGNPLFVSELLRLPGFGAGGASSSPPASLRALMRARLASFGPEQLAVLAAAALVGRQFTLPLLAEVAEVSNTELQAVADAAVQVGVLEELVPSHYRFTHVLVAETLALDLEPARRRRLHRRAAEALERWFAADSAAVVNEIARHWLEAGAEVAALAVAAAERAARQAVMRLAFSDAAALYERALQALVLCSPLDAQRQGDLLVAQVEALARAGRRERAEAVCAEVVELARARGDGELLARAALALGAENYLGSADRTVARLLERALGALRPGDGALRALVSARLASARQPEVDPEPPMALAREAIAMVRRLGDPALSSHVIHAALGALMDFAPAEERAALNAEALELATGLGDHARALAAAQRLAFDRLELGDLDGFERALDAYEATSAEVEQPRYAWVPLMFRAMRADWEGDRERAEHWEREARAIREQGNAEGLALVPARPLARALLHADAALLEPFVVGLLERTPHGSGALWLSALLAAWRGDTGAAREALDTLAARGLSRFVGRADAANQPATAGIEPSYAVGLGYLHMPEVAVELACHLGDAAWAGLLYRELSSSAGKPFLLTTIAFSLHGAVDHALMRLSAVEQRWELAERHAARAVELVTRLRAAPLLARIHQDAEHVARARLAQATGGARAAGGIAALHPDGAAPVGAGGAAARRHDEDPLRLEREGDYWTVSAGGKLVRVQDNRGMHMLARLVEQPGRELHVLELSGSPSGVDRSDAGEVLDARAHSEYATRLRELRSEMDEASSDNDLGRHERLAEEAEALSRELARGFGLGGRARRSASAVERARINVRRRLTLALRRIVAASPELGAQLEASLRTGVFCVYTPRRAP